MSENLNEATYKYCVRSLEYSYFGQGKVVFVVGRQGSRLVESLPVVVVEVVLVAVVLADGHVVAELAPPSDLDNRLRGKLEECDEVHEVDQEEDRDKSCFDQSELRDQRQKERKIQQASNSGLVASVEYEARLVEAFVHRVEAC